MVKHFLFGDFYLFVLRLVVLRLRLGLACAIAHWAPFPRLVVLIGYASCSIAVVALHFLAFIESHRLTFPASPTGRSINIYATV